MPTIRELTIKYVIMNQTISSQQDLTVLYKRALYDATILKNVPTTIIALVKMKRLNRFMEMQH